MQTTAQQLKLIIFELNKEEYSIPVQQVRSIEKLIPITRVPNVPAHIKGVINLRGVITPIVDLRTRFDFPQKQYDERTRIIITAVGEIEVGFIVDAANDVLDILEESIEPAPEVVGAVETKYVQGVVKIDRRLFVCLDLHEVLQLESIHD